jgi:hypothetical protein
MPHRADAVGPGWLDAKACQLVAELLEEEDVVVTLGAVIPKSDETFAAELVDHELGLIADGRDPLRVALSIQVIGTARSALILQDAIRRLPEATSQRRHAPRF